MTTASELDPRTKLTIIICLTSAAVIINHWAFLSGIFFISFFLLMVFGVHPWGMMKRIKVLMYMVVAIALMQSIFAPSGQTLLAVGSLKLVTSGGLIKAGEFILRMLIIIVSAGILSTSNHREVIQGLVQWKLPYEIAFMASMGIRFLPVFAEEFKDAMLAVQLRGVDLKKLPLRQKLEVTASLFQPVVAGALLKSKAIAMSIEMRGFRAYPSRTSYLVLELKRDDYLIMFSAVLLTVAVLVGYFLFFSL
jgi:energy-coupling factor transport system permease protein